MKSKQGPGPDTYKDPPKFGSQATKPALRQRLSRYGDAAENYSPFYFAQQKSLPGPGFYTHMNVTGKDIFNSSFMTERKCSFNKDGDRFRLPKAQSPACTKYRPKDNMNEQMVGSEQYRAPVTKFIKCKISPCDVNFNMRRAKMNPGPGQYERYSEFCPK